MQGRCKDKRADEAKALQEIAKGVRKKEQEAKAGEREVARAQK
jgi:hypothetical protein